MKITKRQLRALILEQTDQPTTDVGKAYEELRNLAEKFSKLEQRNETALISEILKFLAEVDGPMSMDELKKARDILSKAEMMGKASS